MRIAAHGLRFTKALCLVVLCIAPASSISAQAQSDDEGKLSAAIRKLAENITVFMQKNAQVDSLSLGAFRLIVDKVDHDPTFGKEIKEMLTEELTKARINVKPHGALFSCVGELVFRDNGRDGPRIDITAEVREKEIKRIKFSATVSDTSEITAVFGGTGKLPTDPKRRAASIRDSIQKPAPRLEPTPVTRVSRVVARASATDNAQYAVEIWRIKADRLHVTNPVVSDYEPASLEELDDGHLFVNLNKGDRYAVWLINKTNRLAAATVTIDGMNMFTFSQVKSYQALGKVIVPPGPEGSLVQGWHHTNQESFAFEVCDIGEAAVSKRPESGKVEEALGVITVRFADATDVATNQEPLADEPPSASLGTKLGPLIGQNYTERHVKIGVDREVISLRYSHILEREAG